MAGRLHFSMGNNIGANIRKYRKLKGYTIKELAEKSGLSYVTIVKYEHGERNPKRYSLYRISKALDVCISEIVK
jgi:transcriptional regulator with XRE-family HTH domain